MNVINKKIYSYFKDNQLDIEMVMHDYTSYIYGIIKKYYTPLPKEDIEEITLDVFLTLWNNQEKLDINNSISAYIAGITKNLIKKKCNKLKIHDDIEDYDNELKDLSNIELLISNREKTTIALNELNKLKPKDIDIFMSYYYEGKKIKEICSIYNMSESKVKSKLFRVRKKLKKSLNERGYDLND